MHTYICSTYLDSSLVHSTQVLVVCMINPTMGSLNLVIKCLKTLKVKIFAKVKNLSQLLYSGLYLNEKFLNKYQFRQFYFQRQVSISAVFCKTINLACHRLNYQFSKPCNLVILLVLE